MSVLPQNDKSDEALRVIVLTGNKLDRDLREACLEELLSRARREGGSLDYELMQDLKRS